MKIIGHRGARGLAPENTLAAIKKALECNVDGLEFDLRVTKDGKVILHHDPNLTDPSGQQLAIAETAYKELLAHKQDLATLEQALDFINQRVPLYIEVKPGVDTGPIVKIIKSYLAQGWHADKMTGIASFSQKTLLELHRQLPEIPVIVIERWSGVRAGYRARQLNTKLISMNQRWLWSGFVKAVRRSGYTLYAYTINDPARARQLAKWGLQGAVTDYPDRFHKP